MHTYTYSLTYSHLAKSIEKKEKYTSQNHIIWTDFIHRFERTMSRVYVNARCSIFYCVSDLSSVDGQTVTVCVWVCAVHTRMYETRCDSFFFRKRKSKTSERWIFSPIYLVKSDINCVHLSIQQQLPPPALTHTRTPPVQHTTVVF